MTESRRGRRPTPDQRRARQERDEAKAASDARKQRTRQLIQMGGVLASYGFSTPMQVDEVIAQVMRSKVGPARLRELGVERTDRWPQD